MKLKDISSFLSDLCWFARLPKTERERGPEYYHAINYAKGAPVGHSCCSDYVTMHPWTERCYIETINQLQLAVTAQGHNPRTHKQMVQDCRSIILYRKRVLDQALPSNHVWII